MSVPAFMSDVISIVLLARKRTSLTAGHTDQSRFGNPAAR